MSRRLLVPALVVLVVLAGCGATGGASQAAPSDLEADADARPEMTNAPYRAQSTGAAGGGGSGGGSDGTVAQIQQRQLIQTATVRLEVDDYGTARESLASSARQRGGFVSDASATRHTTDAGNYTTGTVTFRVPTDQFEPFLSEVEQTGTVVSSDRNTEDVTDQLVDINARLENLRAQRDRLRQLYEDANETEDVLRVERRLSEVQTEIERLEARRASLNRQVSLSTVTVELREPEPDRGPIEEDSWYDTPLTSALLESIHGVGVVLRASAVAFAYLLPYLVVFGGPPVAVIYLAYRRWGGSATESGDGSEVAPPSEANEREES